jgi:hypothetical protein
MMFGSVEVKSKKHCSGWQYSRWCVKCAGLYRTPYKGSHVCDKCKLDNFHRRYRRNDDGKFNGSTKGCAKSAPQS